MSRSVRPRGGDRKRDRFGRRPALVLALALVLGAVALVAVTVSTRDVQPVVYTVGDVHALHAAVTVGGREVFGERRIVDGDAVKTGRGGRARLRLDDGTLIAVDGSTSLVLRGDTLSLESGRIFVEGGRAPRIEVELDNATTRVSSSAVAFERGREGARLYCSRGEVVLSVAGRRARVTSGETARLAGARVTVFPEKAFDDWTGGLAGHPPQAVPAKLAGPWSGPMGDRSAIPEVRAGAGGIDPGSPLVVRSHRVQVEVDGEVAVTRARTTYFNGSSAAARAQVRFALPDGAILTRIARRSGSASAAEEAKLVISAGPSRKTSRSYLGIEWAGSGWLQGDLGNIDAGETLELAFEYTEWLPMRSGRATYRFPMANRDDATIVGELDAEVDVTGSETPFVSATAGAQVQGKSVVYRRADVLPGGDLVVELAPRVVRARVARAYVMSGPKGEDPYVMVRTELPDAVDPSVALVLVIDDSMSVGSPAFATARAVVDAILERLGPRDSIAVLAADETVRAMGPGVPTPVDARLRSEVRRMLGATQVGGASNIGLALERATDILDAPSRGERAGAGMVVYVGDGRPSIGELDAASIRRRVSRRAGGIPRLGAVAVGPGADRLFLAELVAGAGPVHEVVDTIDAGHAASAIVAGAFQPTLRDVALDLGPSIDRIYPRTTHTMLAGSTMTIVGRLRGALPDRVRFRFRDGSRFVEESRLLERLPLPRGADVAARWAEARIEEMTARDEGIEPSIVLARDAKLLTPWTSWLFTEPGADQSSVPFAERVLDLSPAEDVAFAAHIEDPVKTGSTLFEPPTAFGGGVSLGDAAAIAVRRILDQATKAVRACSDARASVRPEVPRSFAIDVSVNADGHATQTRVVASHERERDPILERCVKGVVESLPFVAAGVMARVSHSLTVPEGRGARRTQCSSASRVPLPIRKSIWRARAAWDEAAYVAAATSCELATWADRRAFLLLALEKVPDTKARLQVAAGLEAAGESDAATFVRSETLRRVTSFSELESLRRILVEDEPVIDAELDKAYKRAPSDVARLAVVRRFLLLAPHNALARRRLLSLLEALGQRDALLHEIEALRAEPFADGGLLAQAASALHRIGHRAESRRAFGELIERSPRDPWTLAFVGDRLRAEGMFDEAVTAYESLERMQPNDAAVLLRMALAHAGAGRLDMATRLLERVAQTGGRSDDGALGELAAIAEAVLLAGAPSRGTDPESRAELERRLVQTPLPDVASVVMVQSAPSDEPVEVRILREQGERVEQGADLDARALGLSAIRIERGDGGARILLRRHAETRPSRALRARVAALVLDPDAAPVLVLREVDVAADGLPVEVRFDGSRFL